MSALVTPLATPMRLWVKVWVRHEVFCKALAPLSFPALKSRLVGGVFVRLLTDLKGFIIHGFRCPPIYPPTNAPSEKCTSLDLTVQQSVKFWA